MSLYHMLRSPQFTTRQRVILGGMLCSAALWLVGCAWVVQQVLFVPFPLAALCGLGVVGGFSLLPLGGKQDQKVKRQ